MKLSRSESAQCAHMARRILSTFGDASAADLADGLAWYERAAEAASAMLPHDPTRAAGVIAALSPRCAWSTNVAWAARVIEAAEEGADCPAVSTRAFRAIAWSIATGAVAPADALKGPKVRAFFANITGDPTRVTVDTWAYRVAMGYWAPHPTKRDQLGAIPSFSARRYALIEHAYQRAADALGVSPRECQAAVWVHARGGGE